LATLGKAHFATFCIACHGPDGTGNQALGAPDLTNGIWLYGGTPDQIAFTVRHGRNGIMPPHLDLLGEDRTHILAAYIASLRAPGD
jgi:cytochrome c oxidase cbb3-type subunit 3